MERILRAFRGKKNESKQDLHRSSYSLVSCKDLNTDNLQLWLGLPEEVKQDPSLELIRKKYEETDKLRQSKSNGPEFEATPLKHVDSESLLTQNGSKVSVTSEKEAQNGRGDDEVETESPCHTETIRSTRTSKAQQYTKMAVLIGCWLFFTSVFLLYPEKEENSTNLAVVAGQILDYPITSSNSGNVELKLKGRFLPQHAQSSTNSSGMGHLHVGIPGSNGTEWSILLGDQEDFSIHEVRTLLFDTEPYRNYTVRLRTNSTKAVPFVMSHNLTPVDFSLGVVYAVVLLCGLYILIIFEIIHRTMAAILVCTCSLAALALVGERPDLPELVSWLDIETLLLLFSMMILVAIMAETGIFDYLAVFTFEITKGKLWPLIFLLCFSTAFFSTFLDNVTTVLLMSPVVIRLCEVMDLDPVPILMLMAIYSNIGGTATPVGDPPNVIVASNKVVMDAGINFTNFTAHMALGILLVCVQTSLQVKFIFRDTKTLRLQVPREIQGEPSSEIRYQLSIWRRAADSLPHLSNDVSVVREALEKKIKKLNVKLEKMIKDSRKRACPKETFQTTLEELKAKYKIRDKALLIKSTVAILFVVVLFFLHSIPELNRVSLAWTALLGALLLLILADRADLEPILHRVEWSTLLFFAALFVLIEAMAKLGLIMYIGRLIEKMILSVDESSRLTVALMVTLWVTGTVSAFVDNVPITTMMVRVIITTAHNPALHLPLPPLIWALLYGACLGGNGTLIGASANIVCAGVAEQHGYKFTFCRFFKVGFPLMIGHFLTASVYLIICHCVFTWH